MMLTMNHNLFVILGLFIVFEPIVGLKVGEFFQICKRNDPNLNECIKNVINKVRPSLKSGIKELQIPSLDPMMISEVTLFRSNGPVSLDAKFKNLKVEGITSFKIKQVRAELENNLITIDVEVPILYIESDYDMKGRMLVLPVSGKGDSHSNYTEVSGPLKLEFIQEEKNGKNYLTLKSVKFDSSVKRALMHMNNLFNGNKELGDTMNNFMSTNWEVVFKELKPVVDEAIAAILTEVGKKVFEKFTYDELFPL